MIWIIGSTVIVSGKKHCHFFACALMESNTCVSVAYHFVMSVTIICYVSDRHHKMIGNWHTRVRFHKCARKKMTVFFLPETITVDPMIRIIDGSFFLFRMHFLATASCVSYATNSIYS